MSKLLVLIASGPNDPAKVKAGLGFARVAKAATRSMTFNVAFWPTGWKYWFRTGSLHSNPCSTLLSNAVFLLWRANCMPNKKG